LIIKSVAKNKIRHSVLSPTVIVTNSSAANIRITLHSIQFSNSLTNFRFQLRTLFS